MTDSPLYLTYLLLLLGLLVHLLTDELLKGFNVALSLVAGRIRCARLEEFQSDGGEAEVSNIAKGRTVYFTRIWIQ